MRTRRVVAPCHHLAARASHRRIRLHAGPRPDIGRLRIAHRRIAPLVVATDEHRSSARGAGGVERGSSAHGHVVTEHLHLAPASARLRRARVQHTRHLGDARVAAVEDDASTALAEPAGAHDAGLVDHPRADLGERARAQQHLPAVGDHGTAVVDEGLERGSRDGEAGQSVAGQVQRHLLARSHRDSAELRADRAVVGHPATHQRHGATLGDADRAGVLDRSRPLQRAEAETVGDEVVVVDVERGGHQRPHVHRGRLAEHHAVAIDQEDLAVGVQAALNLAARSARHPVEDGAAGPRLLDPHLFARADRETLPVDDGLVARLPDHHARRVGPAHLDHPVRGGVPLGKRPRRPGLGEGERKRRGEDAGRRCAAIRADRFHGVLLRHMRADATHGTRGSVRVSQNA